MSISPHAFQAASAPAAKPPVDIGTRRELFVDDFLIESKSGTAIRRLHQPVPRNVAIALDKPWDGRVAAYPSVVEHEGRFLLFYSARPKGLPHMTAVLESKDGIYFHRPNIGAIAFEGSTNNNLVHRGGISHNLSMFIDTNPKVPEDERLKAVGGRSNLSVLVSPDGMHWRHHARVSQQRPFDSQNIVFWDSARERYVAYMRAKPDVRDGKRILLNLPQGQIANWVRDIRMSTSADMTEWSEPTLIDYRDNRIEHLYTNCIQPYPRAPHILVGMPKRFIPARRKVTDAPSYGLSDVLFMSSRDGVLFDRWPEAFIRPDAEPEVWTDRNYQTAWGMVRTAPDELSIYWAEHYRHPGIRIRRGTLRTDGFVSLHADHNGGEALTRPLIFAGRRLVVNYQTSAAGDIRFELTDAQGAALPGFGFSDSETLFGNEIAHMVSWNGNTDLSALQGQPVRLRLRLKDADLYAIRFASDSELRDLLTHSAANARGMLSDSPYGFAPDRREAVLNALETLDRAMAAEATPSPAWLRAEAALGRALHAWQAKARIARQASRVVETARDWGIPNVPDSNGLYAGAVPLLEAALSASLDDADVSLDQVETLTKTLEFMLGK